MVRSLFGTHFFAKILLVFVAGIALLGPFAVLPGQHTARVDLAVAHADNLTDPATLNSSICPDNGFFNVERRGCETLIWTARGLFTITGMFASVAGQFFDWMLWYTIQSSTYADAPFIEKGWGILRDIANIVFIIALILAAVKIMFSKLMPSAGNGKRLVAMVIVSALFVNFSLFLGKLVIDASHILAYAFYNQIQTNIDYNLGHGFNDGASRTQTIQDEKIPISEGLLAQINPQSLVTNEEVLTIIRNQETNGWIPVLILYSFMTVVHVILIGVFVSVALLFLGRTVALMFGLIASPLAFALLATPLRGTKMIGFNNWFRDLTKNAFMVVVFLFFIYLTVLFMGVTMKAMQQGFNQIGVGFGQMLLNTIIPLAIVMALLIAAKNVAENMAGEIATKVSAGVAKAAGAVAGTALAVGAFTATGGAAALAGGVGRAAQLAGKTKMGNKLLGGDRGIANIRGKAGFISRQAASMGDPRNTAVGQLLNKNLAAVTGVAGLSLGAGTKFSWQNIPEGLSSKYQNYLKTQQDYESAGLEKEKSETQNEQLQHQVAADKVIQTKEYLDAEKEQQGLIDDLAGQIADTKKDVAKSDKEYKQARDEANASEIALSKIDKNKNKKAWEATSADVDAKKALAKEKKAIVDDARDELKKQEDKKTKAQKQLDDDSFFKGSSTAEVAEYNTRTKAESVAKDALREYSVRDRTIDELEAKKVAKTLTAAEDVQRKKLISEKASSKSKAALEADLATARESIATAARTNSALAMYQARAGMEDAKEREKQIDRDITRAKRRVVGEQLEMMQRGWKDMGKNIVESIQGGFMSAAGMVAKMGAGAVAGGLAGSAVGGPLGATFGTFVGGLTAAQLQPLMFKATRAMGVDPVKYKKALRDSLKANQDK